MINEIITKSSNRIKSKKLVKINPYQKFYLTFFLITLMPILGASIFNYIIDPYGIFNSPKLQKFNDAKIKKDDNDRLFKTVDIIKRKPDTIILGSSRTKQGINPENPVFKGKNTYNLGINGSNLYEVKRYLQHAIANNKKIDLVVFGVDFFMFNKLVENQPTYNENRLEKTHIYYQDIINNLFSLDAVIASAETLEKSIKKDEDFNYGKNGFMPSRKVDDGKTKWRFEQGINVYYDFHNEYEFSNQHLENFREIVKICQENNIELKIFISPSHATQWEAIRQTGQWETFEDWKRKLVQISPVWDFSGYNSITTEAIANTMNYYVDNSHYNEAVGNLILNRIYNENIDTMPQDFGVLITPENIEQHLTNIRTNRENWKQNNPEAITLVKKIHQDFLKNKNKE